MKINKLIWQVFRKFGFATLLLRIHPKSALKKLGWFRSFRTKKSVDINGNALPWWTYSIIYFLKERLNKQMRVLEFGCGNSTIWLSKYTKEVISIENHKGWADKVTAMLPSNGNVIHVESLEKFAAGTHEELGLFDVLIIDAGNRMECAIHAIKFIKDNGIVIWDNTDGPDWPDIKGFLYQSGFKEVSFVGLVPQEVMLSKTTIFYRENNCLEI